MRALIFGLLLALLLASPCLADTVKVTKITADISFSKDYGAISAGSTKTIILHLPVTLEELNNTNNNITITADSATASTTIDLYVNGVAVATNYAITGGASHTWSFTDFATAGVNMNTNLLNITIVAVANATSSDVLNLYGVNLPLTANYTVKVTET
ncbi:MAG: hypothetical protein L3J47_10925, partial [Sulfurovum sp.]|nr:hypothetical protein [Sulfurovum sp.]